MTSNGTIIPAATAPAIWGEGEGGERGVGEGEGGERERREGGGGRERRGEKGRVGRGREWRGSE